MASAPTYLASLFPDFNHQMVGIIGTGGKTSLLWFLSRHYQHLRTAVTTTTKMGRSENNQYIPILNPREVQKGKTGVTLLGRTLEQQPHKLIAPDPAFFKTALNYYDCVLAEADGSKRLRLKGWRSFEPVIYPEMTTIIGIVPLDALGMTIDAMHVHCLSEFRQLLPEKLRHEKRVTLAVLKAVIESSTGLFEKSQAAQKVLYINHVQTTTDWQLVAKLVAMLTPNFKSEMSAIIAGDTFQEKGVRFQ